MSDESVHLNQDLNKKVKRWAQKKAMEHYEWDTKRFIEIIGRNYL